jgi:ATP-dependent RNA helicase DOB1
MEIDQEVEKEMQNEKLLKEGELMQEIINTGGVIGGYDENDFVVELHEYPNCTHEYVAPASYVRPEFKRPAKKAK